jgi:hypothetical protein
VNALEMRAPTPGMKVTLTIDSQLQFYCDRELAKAVHDNEFESGSIIIMNPNNGEVYAMSAYPSFNPNLPPKNEADLKRRVHRAIGNAPDGGSVMKMMTVTGALEHTNLRASSLIDCGNGEFRYSSRDSIGDTHSYGVMPMEKVLWFSSNVGAIRIGIEVGKQKLYQILRDFGFGQKTGIDLPGESAGVLNPVEKWQPSSIYFVSIGHDHVTLKNVGWEPIAGSPFAKYHAEALTSSDVTAIWEPGTYELCGPKIQGNMEEFGRHTLVLHRTATRHELEDRSYDSIEAALRKLDWEGFVFHHENTRWMAKIKMRDFGLKRGS